MKLSEQQRKSFEEKGYAVLHGLVEHQAIDDLLSHFLGLVEQISGRRFSHPHSPELASFMNANQDIQSEVYNKIRQSPWLEQFSLAPAIVASVISILGEKIGLLRKIPFRIDAPLETAQFAVWHQDHFYVQGNVDIVTAWAPMQDTSYLNGCLAVMPGSHKLGPLEHDIRVLNKREFPSRIFEREVRYVEVRKGDLILFHSCLLHSSSLNLSESIRYSLQIRYSRLNQPTHSAMGGTIPINEGHAQPRSH